MQISSSSLLSSLAAQISTAAAQTAASIGSTINGPNGAGEPSATNSNVGAATGKTPTSATLASTTLGSLIQQTQTNTASGQPPSLISSGSSQGTYLGLQTSGPFAGWKETDYGGFVEMQPNSQAASFTNAITSASTNNDSVNNLQLTSDAVYYTRDGQTLNQTDFNNIIQDFASSETPFNSTQISAGDQWIANNANTSWSNNESSTLENT